ncbi:MAG: hypothetical protein GX436_01255 [Synergistaceae bacterium]|nr:hypothetical protein [Synergistaceae bacterium]
MGTRKGWVFGLVFAFVLVAGCAFAEGPGTAVETQFELAQKFMERAGLTGTAPAEEAAAEEPAPAEEPAVEPAEEEVGETMPPEIAAKVAERHAFIGWAKMNGLPASRNIQEQELWGSVWSGVQAQVSAGVTVQEAMAAVQAEMTEEQLAGLEKLKETPPGQLQKAAKGTAEAGAASTASTETGKGKGKGEGKGEGKGGGKDGKDGKGGGRNK